LTVFVDASALVAVINEESEADAIEASMAAHAERLTSGIAIWETVRAMARIPGNSLETAEREVNGFLAVTGLRLVPIGAAEAAEALRAHARYGKGTGHPARLNMGDCFAYACARTNGARLLYKGDDFSHTDLAR
jgi:ribonuclease VapC